MLLGIQPGVPTYGMIFCEPGSVNICLCFPVPQITEKMTSCKPMTTAMDSAVNGILCGYVADPLVRTSSFKKRRHIK